MRRFHVLRTASVAVGATVGLFIVGTSVMDAVQPPGFNYDEAKVPAYTLPDPLTLADGTRVKDAATWKAKRRPEIFALFEREMYGRSAPRPHLQTHQITETSRDALGGLAIRKQITITLDSSKPDAPKLHLLMYVPARVAATSAGGGAAGTTGASGAAGQSGVRRRVPAFLGLSFQGNQAVNADPAIRMPERRKAAVTPGKDPDARATQAARGAAAGSWPVELILSRGFALVTMWYGDAEPDRDGAWAEGVRATFGPDGKVISPGSGAESASAWGAVAAWGWGLSRALDYLETDPDIDAARVAAIGHSRLGKAVLWAAARDERFAMVVAAQSGEGGAAITRRKFGETITRINGSFPHWFAERFRTYNDREDALPVDAHELVALIAPRPIYISSATEDLWADPRGEFLAAVQAEPVYRLLGTDGFGVSEMPPPDQAVGRTIGYHIRSGEHMVTPADWEHYLAFASRHLSR